MTHPTPSSTPSADAASKKPDAGEKNKYKATLNLPQTSFPMKASLVQNEPASLKRWQGMKVYDRLREAGTGKPKFVFHDGPPYANGNLHLGHLLNKCLKDFVVRSRTMMGFDCPYVPGWDCHGLPIEHKVMTDLQEKGKLAKLMGLADDQRKTAVRRECQAHAEKYVKLQRGQMERFLTLADYEHPYLTFQPSFEGATLEVLAALYEQGLVYRALKPVHWSVANETALAEAELEYQDREDLSVYVDFESADMDAVYEAFGLREEEESHEETESRSHEEAEDANEDEPSPLPPPSGRGSLPAPVSRPLVRPSFMIWTTTPWTLPANLAIAVNPKFDYACVWVDGNVTVLAAEAVERVMKKPTGEHKPEQFVVLGTCPGAKLIGLKYRHPFVAATEGSGSEAFRARETVRADAPIHTIVGADYVTLEDGTGLVHTAPGHGTEDYQTGQAVGLPSYCPVKGDGTYDDTVPDWLRGKSIWKANDEVAQHLKNSGHLFYSHKFTHSYPHDWRSKTPVIFRCTHQWFVGVDRSMPKWGASIRSMGLQSIGFDAEGRHTNESHEILEELAEQEAELRASPPESSRSLSRDEIEQSGMFGGLGRANSVKFVPEWGRNRMAGMLKSRPDWCISRQRSWGMPIPAFTRADGTVFMTAASIRAVAKLVREKGTDVWFTSTPQELLKYYDPASDPACSEPPAQAGGDGRTAALPTQITAHTLSPLLAQGALKKGGDIVDVWFESGSTWNACMRERGLAHAGGPATDLYLEGSDQHRGWFQSSLLNSLGATGHAPFNTLLTHGFIVDKDGKKLSKSRPDAARFEVESLCNEFGMDVMRWWVASLPYENDIKADLSFFAETGESYRKVRNTLRFMLSNLVDFPGGVHACPPAPTSLDAWVLAEYDTLAAQVDQAYRAYDFRAVHQRVYDFCNDTLSAVYLASVKDRLYCDKPDSARRRQTQGALYALTDALCRVLAPIMCHTADEAFRALRTADPKDTTLCVHLEEFVTTNSRPGFGVAADPAWGAVMKARSAAMNAIEQVRKDKGVENPLDMGVTLPDPDGTLARWNTVDLADLLGVSRVTIDPAAKSPTVQDLRSEPRCDRSWKRDGTVRVRSDGGLLSDRDALAVGVT